MDNVYYWQNGAMSYLKYTFLYFENRNIKRTTTKIIHGNSVDKKYNEYKQLPGDEQKQLLS